MIDTISYISSKTNTRDEVRDGLVDVLKLGLVRYLIKTPLAKEISLHYSKPSLKKEAEDKWNNWVYGISASARSNGQESSNNLSVNGSLFANHITTDWKIRMKVRGSYNDSNFDILGTTYSSISRSNRVNATVIRSLGIHWSTGLFGNYRQSSYRNIDQSYKLWGAIEFNFFPYTESTRKALCIQYGVGEAYVDYEEQTIYYKLVEFLTHHHLSLTFNSTQPWDSVFTSLDARQYLHDLSKNQVSL